MSVHATSGTGDAFITPQAVLDGGQKVDNGDVNHQLDGSTDNVDFVKDIPIPPNAQVVGCNFSG